MKTCTYSEEEYFKWERPYVKIGVTSEWVNKNQDKVVMALNLYRLFELVSIRPKKNSDYIYSMSEVFLEGPENAEQLGVRKNWLEHFNFRLPEKDYAVIEHEDGSKEPVPMHAVHASGHMPKEDIVHMIAKIKPDIVIPMHTQHPEAFGKFHKRVVLPELGKSIVL